MQQILGSTILIALMASLQAPVLLAKLSYLIDNPWTVSQARADLAGLILADSLIDRNLGVRPVTLVGFSLGSRVIFSCLRELANKAAFGLVQSVFLFGTPIAAKKDEYLKAKTVFSGLGSTKECPQSKRTPLYPGMLSRCCDDYEYYLAFAHVLWAAKVFT